MTAGIQRAILHPGSDAGSSIDAEDREAEQLPGVAVSYEYLVTLKHLLQGLTCRMMEGQVVTGVRVFALREDKDIAASRSLKARGCLGV